MLAYPDFILPFELHTDASADGLGAVLYQTQENKVRVIGHASRALTNAEKNYHIPSGKLKFLSVKWAVCDHFRDYLYYAPHFTVYIDCNSLTYILTTARLNATGFRWIAELADFRFSTKYRPGSKNQITDTLSRLPLDSVKQLCTEETSMETVDAIMHGVKAIKHCQTVHISLLKTQPKVELPDEKFFTEILPNRISGVSLIRAQEEDPIIGKVRQCVMDRIKPQPTKIYQELPETKILFGEFRKLEIGETEFWSGSPAKTVLFKSFYPESIDL